MVVIMFFVASDNLNGWYWEAAILEWKWNRATVPGHLFKNVSHPSASSKGNTVNLSHNICQLSATNCIKVDMLCWLQWIESYCIQLQRQVLWRKQDIICSRLPRVSKSYVYLCLFLEVFTEIRLYEVKWYLIQCMFLFFWNELISRPPCWWKWVIYKRRMGWRWRGWTLWNV